MLIAMRSSNPFYVVLLSMLTVLTWWKVKLITYNDVPGSVEEWHIPGKLQVTECVNNRKYGP